LAVFSLGNDPVIARVEDLNFEDGVVAKILRQFNLL